MEVTKVNIRLEDIKVIFIILIMFTNITISLMESLLNTTDPGLKLTKKFVGNILVFGGRSNENTMKLCETVLNFAPNSAIYHFNNIKPTKLKENHCIQNGYRYKFIYCNLQHTNGFINAINTLNRERKKKKQIQFDYFINLTLFNPPAKHNLILNIIAFQARFNESVINVMKAMRYILETHYTGDVYMINCSVSSSIDWSYMDIDYLICSSCIRQFHDSLSSEIHGKCLLIYLPNVHSTKLPFNKIIECLKKGYNGEYYLRTPGINSILNETYHLLYDWA